MTGGIVITGIITAAADYLKYNTALLIKVIIVKTYNTILVEKLQTSS